MKENVTGYQVSSSIPSQLWGHNPMISPSTLRLFILAQDQTLSWYSLVTCTGFTFAPAVSDVLAISSLSAHTVRSLLHPESGVGSGKYVRGIQESSAVSELWFILAA